MLTAGFTDPVEQAQGIFHAVMTALSQPGTLRKLGSGLQSPPLRADMASIALSLCDHETPIWLDPALPATDAVSKYLAFHTGSPLTADKKTATFAFVAEACSLSSLDEFALGSDTYPDRSTTIIAAVTGFDRGKSWRASGPGIDGTIAFLVDGLPVNFAARWAGNHSLFPRGVDLLLVDGTDVLALPRSVVLTPAEEQAPCM
ncbi:alpha-D-ribose 1-methylphosphonate 5-triphosphate synthase subunit PhnH [Arboricoccus pini]|uniref:Alpha-D-ribose 1-methylphosphonate 5-triphosphate synthase subunit PhnH n=1 Tax=Arboricoccus pini TaxID=1963835 RepID=A0A212R2G1_9PROT|nr:phosphonate C-P lyase system protein PhnH [Arboricoccus pini]SNB66038.1 alpha-D-ribose 1-methylphosphonate 5-triphosphate synthase subunit PhnH [Arboricoccus pini]